MLFIDFSLSNTTCKLLNHPYAKFRVGSGKKSRFQVIKVFLIFSLHFLIFIFERDQLFPSQIDLEALNNLLGLFFQHLSVILCKKLDDSYISMWNRTFCPQGKCVKKNMKTEMKDAGPYRRVKPVQISKFSFFSSFFPIRKEDHDRLG